MAPPKGRGPDRPRGHKVTTFQRFYQKYVNLEFVKSLVFDPSRLPIVSVAIVLAEILLNVIVVQRVPYTEIDWVAYMQECEGFLNGTMNYALLKGDTGPLVYPAGFVYIYSGLYMLTSHGQNIRLAQYIFIGIYIAQLCLVLRLYSKSMKVPPYVMALSIFTSYRIHSIYVLRLFNDPIAVLFLYLALNLFLAQKWNYGSVFFSLAVSVKMNILLFAPAVFLLYLTNLGYFGTFKQLVICGLIQLWVGAPFLLTYPLEYIKGSFDLGRVFEHKWTVNYRFLDRALFEHKTFHIGLLALHLSLLTLFAPPCYRYLQSYCRLKELERQFKPQIVRENARIAKMKGKTNTKPNTAKQPEEKLTKEQQSFLDSFEKSLKKPSGQVGPSNNQQKLQEEEKPQEKLSVQFGKTDQLALLPLFLSNFIGMVCARSLHYQFYVWYFHSLPYLVWCTDFSLGLRFLLLGVIEYCWNVYPSTNFSSLMLHCCHIVLLYGIGRKLFKTKNISDKVK
ncbi:lethal(2)neighbour of tid protein 2 [Hermetia illucens]|uniref:lethal(2)neighbour of tid protein 2 n=1 Tax=Hermetia illucens TaxID=343691 RepID=UPI0018CC3865|nr:lethal(2)neighbour of tid protein 2 [Hermetia illucens]